MAKFPEAEARLFHNVFVCKKCKSKLRAPSLKVFAGKIICRKCGSKALRSIKKK
ncbi:50S ribosomal protein L40e [Candidatus Woesearchaeota archaeon]|nr:50S ribosomal protein L40e [Candidatus Woesearchaeota archaeon]